jgi:hypothetical protein
MKFNVNEALLVLSNTPSTLRQLLHGLSEKWTSSNEGNDSWSAFDIVGHLIHGEKTDWMVRTQLILKQDLAQFEPFDRFAQKENSIGKSLLQLLDEFELLRQQNLSILKATKLTTALLQKKARHPALGTVTLEQLLSSWVVHDLNHIAQACRVMSKQYQDEVGPWKAYLGILHS